MRRSVVEPMRLDDLMKLDQGLRQMRLGVQLAEAMAEQAVLLSKQEAWKAQHKYAEEGGKKHPWNHALIERFPANPDCPSRTEVWIIFRPEDVEIAREFHSYPYWKHALERGDTVLCSGNMMSWNVLSESDVIKRIVPSPKTKVTIYEMEQMVRDASKKFGL